MHIDSKELAETILLGTVMRWIGQKAENAVASGHQLPSIKEVKIDWFTNHDPLEESLLHRERCRVVVKMGDGGHIGVKSFFPFESDPTIANVEKETEILDVPSRGLGGPG